jgi:hypothetical protein
MAAQQAKLFFVILSLSAFACCDTGIIYFLFLPYFPVGFGTQEKTGI